MTSATDYIFVSYSRDDKQRVLAAVGALKANGLSIWIDESDIPVSVPWLDEITDAIRGAALVLVFDSWSWYSSGACASELKIAESLAVGVAHIDAENTPPQEVVDLVRSRLNARSASQRDRTDLLARSANWRRSAKPKRLLARGRSLAKFVKLVGTDVSLPNDVHAFVAASKKRRTRDRWLGVGGSLVVTVAIQAAGLASNVNSGVLDRILKANSSLIAGAEQAEITTYNTYAGMDMLAAQSGEGFGLMRRITEALSVSVPTQVLVEPFASSTAPQGKDAATDPLLGPLVANKLCWSLNDTEKLLAICDAEKQSLSLIDAQTGELLMTRWIPDLGKSARFSPDSRLLAVGSGQNIALIATKSLSDSTVMLTGSMGTIQTVGFTGDGGQVWGSSPWGTRAVWEVPGGRTLVYDPNFWPMDSTNVASDESGGDTRVAVLSRDGRVVVAGPSGGQTQTWDIGGTATSIATHGTLPLVAVSSVKGNTGEIQLFQPGQSVGRRIELQSCRPVDTVFRSDHLYAACLDSDIIEIDYSSGEVRRLELGIYARSVAVARDKLLVGDYYGAVLLVSDDMTSARNIADGCIQGANRLAATPDGRYVFNTGLSATSPGCLARIQVPADGAEPARHSLVIEGVLGVEARGVTVSPDSKLIAYGFADGSVRIFDVESLNPTSVHEGLGSEIRGISFAADGRTLVLATRNGRIASLDVTGDYHSAEEKKNLLRLRVDRAVEMGLYKRIIEFRDGSAESSD